MRPIKRLGAILAARELALLTFLALLSLTGGIAIKFDLATAAIVTGTLLLADIELSPLVARSARSAKA